MQAVNEFAYEGRLLLEQNLLSGERCLDVGLSGRQGSHCGLPSSTSSYYSAIAESSEDMTKRASLAIHVLSFVSPNFWSRLGLALNVVTAGSMTTAVCPQDPGQEPLLPRWRRQALARNFGGILWDSNRLGILGEPAILILRHVKVRSLLSQADH